MAKMFLFVSEAMSMMKTISTAYMEGGIRCPFLYILQSWYDSGEMICKIKDGFLDGTRSGK